MTTRGLPEETALRWRQFADLPRSRRHWDWRNGWRPGRRSYWWFVDLTGEPAVADLAGAYLRDLGLDSLDAAPHLHISLQQVGFADEVSADSVEQLLASARARLRLQPLTLRLGPVDPNPESVVLRVSPWEAIQDHRLRLRRATEAVIGDLPGTDDHFWPHVSIGYLNAETPTGPILQALRSLPRRPPVTVTVRELALVRLGRDDELWSWDRVGTLRLGVSAPQRAEGPR